MMLAKELLEKGQTETVIQFLIECKRSWQEGNEKIDQWIKDIESGKTSNFGSNLFYQQ